MLLRRALGFLLLLATGVLPAFSQMRSTSRTSSFSIDGYVRDETTHQPVPNVRVDLKLSSGLPVNNTFTTGTGNFEFVGLSGGNYVIEIDVKGYEPVQQGVQIRNGSQDGVAISMNKSAINPTTMFGGATISAHQLSVPHKARDEYEKGIELLYSKSDFPGAIAQFERAIKDFPTYYEAYADMGNAYLRLRQMGQAEEALRKSVDLSSGRYVEGLTMLSGLLSLTNRYQEAVTFASKLVQVDPSSWRGPFELARALFGLKDTSAAEKNAIQARDMNPSNAPIYLILANIHIQQQAYAALQKDLDAYLKLDPSGTDAEQVRQLEQELQARKQRADATSKPSESPAMPPDPSGLPALPPPNQSSQ